MLANICKTCGGGFSHPDFLQEHWEKHHKDKECLRCHNLKPKVSKDSLFCPGCERDLNRPHQFLSLQEKLQKQILRSHKKAQKWSNRTSNLLLILEQNTKSHRYNGATLSEFCGHGEKRGRCVPCNPIFANITEETMEKARKAIIERSKLELEKHQGKIRAQKKAQEIIEVELD